MRAGVIRAKPSLPLDRDALDALAWLEAGMPEDQVGYGPDAPKLTPEQLKQFKPASYTFAPPLRPAGKKIARRK